jgi:hypothetical protein
MRIESGERKKHPNARRCEMRTILALLCGFAALAAMAGDAKKTPPISLTKAEVEKCVKTVPDFIKFCPNFNPKTADPNAAEAITKGAVTKAKLQEFAKSHGYSDFSEFAKSMAGVFSAYSVLKIEKMLASLKQQMAANPQMAAIMQAQLKPLKENLKRMRARVTPETLNLVKPYVETLDEAFHAK